MESNFLYGSLHLVSTGIIYADKIYIYDLDTALSDINYICASKISSDKDIQGKDI